MTVTGAPRVGFGTGFGLRVWGGPAGGGERESNPPHPEAGCRTVLKTGEPTRHSFASGAHASQPRGAGHPKPGPAGAVVRPVAQVGRTTAMTTARVSIAQMPITQG